MSQKGRMTNVLIPGIMICFLYLVFKYQDTDSFQNTLSFLFNPDSEYALPKLWQKKSDKSISLQDKELLTVLFRNKDLIVLRAPLSNPVPEVKETAEELFKRATEKYRPSFHTKQNSLPGWLLLLVLIGEIPFYMASQDAHIIATLPLTIFSTVVCITPAYVFCRYFPTFFHFC